MGLTVCLISGSLAVYLNGEQVRGFHRRSGARVRARKQARFQVPALRPRIHRYSTALLRPLAPRWQVHTFRHIAAPLVAVAELRGPPGADMAARFVEFRPARAAPGSPRRPLAAAGSKSPPAHVGQQQAAVGRQPLREVQLALAGGTDHWDQGWAAARRLR